MAADAEKPNWTDAVAGFTCAFTPTEPEPCAYDPTGGMFQVIDTTAALCCDVTLVTVLETEPFPAEFTAKTEKS